MRSVSTFVSQFEAAGRCSAQHSGTLLAMVIGMPAACAPKSSSLTMHNPLASLLASPGVQHADWNPLLSSRSHAAFGTRIMRPISKGHSHCFSQLNAPKQARRLAAVTDKLLKASTRTKSQAERAIGKRSQTSEPTPTAQSPKRGTQPFTAVGNATAATAAKVTNSGARPNSQDFRHKKSRSNCPIRVRCCTTRMKGLCSGAAPNCCWIEGPRPSSHW
mmetsp:Transcript_50898/g.146899  ORF Transcript_50898/g.146899 Transcript_50898/m.146899 type:complete len:218 (-) Transcript_50898:551-1204(-)